MCITDDRYDFDKYFEKFCLHYPQPADPYQFALCPGPWIISVGSARKGAPEECIEAFIRMNHYIGEYLKISNTSRDKTRGEFRFFQGELSNGELLFFKGELAASESLINNGLDRAYEHKLYDIAHRVLFYILRISIAQGNYYKAEKIIKEMKHHLNETQYPNRYINYDVSLSWYYYILGLPDKIPEWVKENFTPYGFAGSIDNYGNQVKARYCYMTRNYLPLLSYIHDMKQRESFLFGRLEMLAIEACVHYKMKDKQKAYDVLLEAYKDAEPNGIVMPFIELGKDMRTLTSSAIKEFNGEIPKEWLECINRKAASYAKRQAHVIVEFKHANNMSDNIILSPRESDILKDLSYGHSRAEIAVSRSLSINTVKMVINSIYSKVGAENLADLIRISVEKRLV
jgi:LuxR family maltose regulon positive regulatory protein